MAVEPPITLDQPPARSLGLWDQLALWGSLGVSLLLPVTAVFIISPDPTVRPLSLLAALAAIAAGTIIGNVLLGLGAMPGAETGAPAMVLLRGLFGRRGSWVPTALNLLQCLGWSTFEIVIIAETADRLIGGGWRWPLVLIVGLVATLMAVRPLAVVRIVKKYVSWLVVLSTVYLFVEVLRHPLGSWTHGSWDGFWKSTDIVLALAVSWIPLAADYTRHARRPGEAFVGAAIGYGVTSAALFALGVFALAGLHLGPNADVLGAFIAIPAGTLALVILVVDEMDEAFANIYSTAVSVQNLRPRVDRRLLAVGVGTSATVLALTFNIAAYQNFLLLIGSVFVPLFACFAVAYYLLRRGEWDVSEDAPAQWWMLVPWVAGFVVYQLVNPGGVTWWADWWVARQGELGFTPPTWMSASIASFVVTAVLAVVVGRATTPPRRLP